jgi:hypothetical protein
MPEFFSMVFPRVPKGRNFIQIRGTSIFLSVQYDFLLL